MTILTCKTRLFLFLSFVLLVLPAFGSTSVSSDIVGTSWQLLEFEGGDGRKLVPSEGSSYEIRFGANGKLTAKIDCNRGSGTWSSSGPNRLKFGAMALTRMACLKSGGVDRIARDWMNITSYTLKDGKLYLSLMADGGVYAFGPLSDTKLEGTSWKLVRFLGSDDTSLSPAAGVSYEFTFATGGRVSGRIHCNRASGTWSSDSPNSIKLGPMAVTMMACPGDGGVDRIGRDWQSIRSYTIKDGRLYLSLMADAGTYEFAPLAATASISGTVSYRERIALPAGATVLVQLLDVSKADAPAETVAEQRIETNGKQIPISYELTFDPTKIIARRQYSVVAQIFLGDKMMFRGNVRPAIVKGKPTVANVLVRRTSR